MGIVANEAILSPGVGNALPEDFHVGSFRLGQFALVSVPFEEFPLGANLR
jgi:hypothetical protein